MPGASCAPAAFSYAERAFAMPAVSAFPCAYALVAASIIAAAIVRFRLFIEPPATSYQLSASSFRLPVLRRLLLHQLHGHGRLRHLLRLRRAAVGRNRRHRR